MNTLLVAAIDPSITTIATAVIAAVVTITTLWFGYKTLQLNKQLQEQAKRVDVQDVKIAEVIKTSDGMKTELVKVTAEASTAKGILEGLALAENKAAVAAVAHAAGVAERESNGEKSP